MKLVSIIGDSISTSEGYNPKGYEVFYDRETQQRNQMNSVYDSWWAKVNQELEAFNCVNNSYSGSTVTGNAFPAGYSKERVSALRTAEFTPDIILVYIGFNDFGTGAEVSRSGKWFSHADPSVYFEDAYEAMLKGIQTYNPGAVIVCGTLMKTRIEGNPDWIFPNRFSGTDLEEYNEVIRQTTVKNHCVLADLAATGARYETLDGTHPTAKGHETIAKCWISCLRDAGILKPSIEDRIVRYYEDRYSDSSIRKVYEALLKERVVLFMDKYDEPARIIWNEQTIIPVFTSANAAGTDMPYRRKLVSLKDHLADLADTGYNLVIDPFSGPQRQFILNSAALKQILMPMAEKPD